MNNNHCSSLNESLSKLQNKILNDCPKRLTVEAKYILTDALAYYKHHDFDAHYPLRVTYKNQAGVDAGGVKRQFYSDIFRAFEDGAEGLPPLFIGQNAAKVICYNPVIAGSDLLETAGKIVAHSIVQTGIGMTNLSRAIYQYLVSDIHGAMPFMVIQIVPNKHAQDYLLKLKNMEGTELTRLNADDDFTFSNYWKNVISLC